MEVKRKSIEVATRSDGPQTDLCQISLIPHTNQRLVVTEIGSDAEMESTASQWPTIDTRMASCSHASVISSVIM